MPRLRPLAVPLLAMASMLVLASGSAAALTVHEAIDDVLSNSGRNIISYAKENYCPSGSPGYYRCNLDDGFTISFEDVGGKIRALSSSKEFAGDEESVSTFNAAKRILTNKHKPQEVTKNQSSPSASESRGSDDYKCSHQIGPSNQMEFKTSSKSKSFLIVITQVGRIDTTCRSYGRVEETIKHNPVMNLNVYEN